MSKVYLGNIYKIICNNRPRMIYVGSTISTLDERFLIHKLNSKTPYYKNNKFYNYVKKNKGWDNFKIVLLEKFYGNNMTELRMKEEEYRTNLHANLNTIKCNIKDNPQTHYLKNKKYYDEYKKRNKEKIKKYNIEYQRQYKLKHKEELRLLFENLNI